MQSLRLWNGRKSQWHIFNDQISVVNVAGIWNYWAVGGVKSSHYFYHPVFMCILKYHIRNECWLLSNPYHRHLLEQLDGNASYLICFTFGWKTSYYVTLRDFNYEVIIFRLMFKLSMKKLLFQNYYPNLKYCTVSNSLLSLVNLSILSHLL